MPPLQNSLLYLFERQPDNLARGNGKRRKEKEKERMKAREKERQQEDTALLTIANRWEGGED